MKKYIAFLTIILCLNFVGCGSVTKDTGSDRREEINTDSVSEAENGNMTLLINGKRFEAELYDNETAAELKKRLPLTLNMKELNGNEKYCYLDKPLPAKQVKMKKIYAGDIMLFGDNCLVVFYESFTTSYSYTKIGKIIDASSLKDATGSANTVIVFN